MGCVKGAQAARTLCESERAQETVFCLFRCGSVCLFGRVRAGLGRSSKKIFGPLAGKALKEREQQTKTDTDFFSVVYIS